MITLITKPTDACNARCVYCSVGDKAKRPERMTLDLVRRLFERVAAFLSTHDEWINITWHGGEPLLMGPAFYKEVIRIEEEVAGKHRDRIRHSMQSNLTMLTDAWEDVFKALRIEMVGSSFEFLPGLRGLGRNVDWRTYHKLFFDAVERLEGWGIGFGVIYVVTSDAIDRPEDVINLCMNVVQRSGGIRLNPLYLEGEARRDEVRPLGVDARKFGHFLGRAFRVWWPQHDVAPNVEPFQAYCKKLLGESNDLCCDDSGVCGDSHLGIDPLGRVYQCGRAMDTGILEYGHLNTHSLEEILNHPLKVELEGRTAALAKTDCASCEVFHLCHGGCPIDGYIYKDRWHGSTIFCESKKIFLSEYLLPALEQDAKKSSVPLNRECYTCQRAANRNGAVA